MQRTAGRLCFFFNPFHLDLELQLPLEVFLNLPPMAGLIAICARPSALLSRGKSSRHPFSLQQWKRSLGVPHSFGVFRPSQPLDGRTSNIRLPLPQQLGVSASSQSTRAQKPGVDNSEQFQVIYRFPAIRLCQAFSRLKLLQTAFTILILPPLWVLYWQNLITQEGCFYGTGVACFAVVMLYAMSFYLRRIIGIMSLSQDGTLLKVSHLTFWGRRKDIYCPVENVMPLADIGEPQNKALLKFKQYDTDRFLYFSLRFGHVTDTQQFVKVFGEF